ncbi:hypothetical protein J6590_096421 [Homalodisca vitripennis]|nr:hypothetical protein J6590_096421 [Homalodisca vitripennis]
MLGFVSGFFRGINSPAALCFLYRSFVRQLVEYASPVWSYYTACAMMRIKELQNYLLSRRYHLTNLAD